MVLALILRFDLFSIQSFTSISENVVNFDVTIFLVVGFILFIGGAFLVYDWWESR